MTRTLEQIIEEAANVIRIRSTIPDMSELAEEAGISRQTLYSRARQHLANTKGAEPASSSPRNVNPATAQGYEVTNQAYRTTTHQGGV